MNSQERATSEPSMDEILASIRRIIAEEPNSAPSGRPGESAGVSPLPSNPLLQPSKAPAAATPAPAAKTAKPVAPAFGRLAEVLRGPSPEASNPAAVTKSNGALDDDLADLLQDAKPLNSRTAHQLPAAAAPAAPSATAQQPEKSAEPSGPATPAPAPNESWAVWRTGASRPSAAPLGQHNATGGPAAAAQPGAANTLSGLAGPGDFGSVVPRRTDAGNSNAAHKEPSLPPMKASSAMSALTQSASKPEPENPAPAEERARSAQAGKPASQGPVVIAAMPAAKSAAPAPSASTPRTTDADGATAPSATPKPETSIPLPPRQIAFNASVASQQAASQSSGKTAEPAAGKPADDLSSSEAETSAAAASALGALAAGLAVSSAPTPSGPKASAAASSSTAAASANASANGASHPATSAVQPAASLAPRAMEQAAPVSNGAVAAPPAAVRSLEDAVSDLLRPMLQQWLSDNMPRIVEKALKVETAKAAATPSGKPPGA